MQDDHEIIEPFGVGNSWCEALARVDHVGPCRRLTFVINDPQHKCRHVVAKLILPAEALADIAAMLATDVNQPTQRLAALSRPLRAN